MWLLGLEVCDTTAWSVRLTSVAVLLSDLHAALFIKTQMKYHYKIWGELIVGCREWLTGILTLECSSCGSTQAVWRNTLCKKSHDS